jgi:hypothetical protein
MPKSIETRNNNEYGDTDVAKEGKRTTEDGSRKSCVLEHSQNECSQSSINKKHHQNFLIR